MRISFLLLALFAVVGTCRGEEVQGSNPAIPVVHTWGDLVATKPIHFEGIPEGGVLAQKAQASQSPAGEPPFRVWVGVDRDKVAAHGAVVFYCLAKDIRFSADGNDLGPFHVRVKSPRQVQTMIDLQKSALADDSGASYTLYAKSVPVRDAGDYVIELSGASAAKDKTSPRVYAQIKVHVVALKDAHPWSPWGNTSALPAARQQLSNETDDDTEIGNAVSNPESGIALPKVSIDGEGTQVKDLPPAQTALPALELETPDPALHLTMEGDFLLIRVKSHFMDNYYPMDDFLTRWWVNGKSWAPDPAKTEPMERAEAAISAFSKNGYYRIHFDLDFKPERLGVKKGDKVGVQLLFCPKGWEYNTAINQALAAASPEQVPDEAQSLPDFSSPSNRIDFIYSGDPLHPQQAPSR